MSDNSIHQYATPIKAHHRLNDMLSPTTSLEVKGHTARWYAEMMIFEFLSDSVIEKIGVEKFKKLPLEEQIKEIKQDFDKEIIDVLWRIKDLGDECSHYNSEKQLSEEKINQIVQQAIGLFESILIDHLKKEPLFKTPNRATIFSTIFPSVRENVLYKLVDFKNITSDYQIQLFDKYILACVKNNNSKKINRRLNDMKKKELISIKMYKFWVDTIYAIEQGIKNNELPIAKELGDCKRNFLDVVNNRLDSNEIKENERLIKIIEKLLEQVEPTEMGNYVAMKSYLI